MPRFKLEVYPEPMSATECGECSFHRKFIPYEQAAECNLFDEILDHWDRATGSRISARRCGACIEAEKASRPSA